MFPILNHLPKSMVKLYNSILPVSAKGTWIFDNMNNKYLDFTSGIGTLSTGHSHPYIISKVTEQLPKIIHCQQQIFKSHPPQIELVEKMLTILPKDLDKLFFTNSGSEAIDNAIKIARKYTNKIILLL